MAFDEQLAERVWQALEGEAGIQEKHMFGGVCIMVSGNMALGIVKNDLMVRVGPDAYEDMLDEPHARIMDFNGKPLKGYVFVDTEGTASDETLRVWVGRGLAFARSLPAK
jgi:TfoX/Sxy family transcriptional regulator of competence genes